MSGMVRSNSWADDAEDVDAKPDFSDVPPLAANPWKKVEPVKPVGVVFEDFEGPADFGPQNETREADRGLRDEGRGGAGLRGNDGFGSRGRMDMDRRDRSDRDRGGRGRYDDSRHEGSDGGRYPDRGGSYRREYDDYPRDSYPRDRERRRDGPPSHSWEPPTDEMLSRIPDKGPFTAFIGIDPRVAFDVTEGEIGRHYHDGEAIRVESVRVMLHKDSGKVKMIFVDFEDAESLKNAMLLEKPFRDHPIRCEVAESRAPARPERPPPRRDRKDDRERARPGIKATEFDVDENDADWMAKRFQSSVRTESADDAKSTDSKNERREKSNPFGDAKPRDEAEYERRKAEERAAARAEDRRRDQEEKRRLAVEREEKGAGRGAGKKREESKDLSGDWRENAKPPEPKSRREQRPHREGKDSKDGEGHAGKEKRFPKDKNASGNHQEKRSTNDAPGVADKKAAGDAAGEKKAPKKEEPKKAAEAAPPPKEKEAFKNPFAVLEEGDD